LGPFSFVILETWLPVVTAIGGSFFSGYFGIRIGIARMEERHIALSDRVARLEARLDSKDRADYEWRHNEYSPTITEIWSEVQPMKAIVDRLERYVHPPK
jgi:hypothetical protein